MMQRKKKINNRKGESYTTGCLLDSKIIVV